MLSSWRSIRNNRAAHKWAFPSADSVTGVMLLSTCIKSVRDAMRVIGIDAVSWPNVMHFIDGRVLAAFSARQQRISAALVHRRTTTYVDAGGAGATLSPSHSSGSSQVWKAATSKTEPRQKQDWFLKGLNDGRTRPLAACGVATLWKPQP